LEAYYQETAIRKEDLEYRKPCPKLPADPNMEVYFTI
jgi:hypothetical protein